MQIQSYPGVQATAWSAPGPLLRGHEPRAAKQLSDFAEGMAPVGAADKAALDAFFKGKRGERSLIEHPPVRGLGTYQRVDGGPSVFRVCVCFACCPRVPPSAPLPG